MMKHPVNHVMAHLMRHPQGLTFRGWRIKSAMTMLLLMVFVGTNAQTIIDDLEAQTNASEGVINIECSRPIVALLGTPVATASSDSIGEIVRSGFRIQVFMGSRPGAARAEATAKQTAIKELFPELPVYMTYNAPNWKLTVGDYTTREEANLVKQQLQRAFPEFGQEMYIVSATIKMYSTVNE